MIVRGTRKSDHHPTPERVFDYVMTNLGINLKKMFDPCPLHAKRDGLRIRWGKKNYINPPYLLIEEFTKKAVEQFLKGNDCYLLFPMMKSDKKFAHRYIFDMGFKLMFFPFRIKFGKCEQPSFDTHCLVIMK